MQALALAIAKLVYAELSDAKLYSRRGETELFRGSVFPSHLALRSREGTLNLLPLS